MSTSLIFLLSTAQAEPTKEEWLLETEFTRKRMVMPSEVLQFNGALQFYGAEGLDGLASSLGVTAEYGMGNDYSLLVSTGARLIVPSNMSGEPGWGEAAVIGGYYQYEETENRQIAFGVGLPLNFGDGSLLSTVGFSSIFRMKIQEKLYVEAGQNILTVSLEPFMLISSPAAALQYQFSETEFASVSIPFYSLSVGENAPDPSIWLLGGDKRLNLRYYKYYSKELVGEVRIGFADFTNPGLTTTATVVAYYRM